MILYAKHFGMILPDVTGIALRTFAVYDRRDLDDGTFTETHSISYVQALLPDGWYNLQGYLREQDAEDALADIAKALADGRKMVTV